MQRGGTPKRDIALFIALAAVLIAAQALVVRGVTGELVINSRVGSLDGMRDHFLHRGAAIAKAFAALSNEVLPVMIGPYLLVFAGLCFFAILTGDSCRFCCSIRPSRACNS